MKFLNALKCKNTGRPPVWLMRQAGRYMPEYRALRAKYSFLEMCHNPELILEVTQLPLKAFGMDAAILFSDILVVAEALGTGLRFEEGVGPIIEKPVASKSDLIKLDKNNIHEKLNYVCEGIKLLLPELKVPLIGFAGGPFTVASYIVKDKAYKQWMFADPEGFHELLDIICETTITYLKMQVDAGVHCIQIFDSWANSLALPQFEEFSLAYMERILKSIDIPVILYCRGSSVFAPKMAALKPAGISIDWNASLAEIRKTVGPNLALQGNLDPDVLSTPLSVIKHEVTNLLDSMAGDPGYIFNLGHGVLPTHTPEAVRTLVETVQNYKPCLATTSS